MNPRDILGGIDDADVAQKAQELLKEASARGEPSDLDELLEEAMRQVEDQQAKAMARCIVRGGKARKVDPFEFLGVPADSGREGHWTSEGATERQRETLEKFGLSVAEVDKLDKGQASRLLDRLIDRAKRGLCSYKQSRVLAGKGLPQDVTRAVAKGWLDAIAGNGWSVPPEVRAEAMRMVGEEVA